MLRLVILVMIAISLVGCGRVITKVQSANGSKADGTVDFSYIKGLYDEVKIDWSESDKKAIQHCKLWGYNNAKRFEAGHIRCISSGMYGECIREEVHFKYQCI